MSTHDDTGRNTGQPLMGRKSLLMGLAASGFVVGGAALLSADTIQPGVNPAPGSAPEWKPSTVYQVGQQVISPNNDVVSAVLKHTSSDTYAQDTARWRLSSAFVRVPAAAEQTVFVTPRGNDANNGLSIKTAKATLAAGLRALGGKAGVIQLGAGFISTNATHGLGGGQEIHGAGRGLSTITYTGRTSLFANATPGQRIYNVVIQDVALVGPGLASDTVGVDAGDISNLFLANFVIREFGVGFKHSAKVLGGAVYNQITNGSILLCGTGAQFLPTGSNGSRWQGVHIDSCTIGVNIVDSNQNNFHACQFEANKTGVRIDASFAGLSDSNSFTYCRFEGNSVAAWNVADLVVRDTQIVFPAVFGPYTYIDKGTRTTHLNSGAYPSTSKSSVASTSGSWMWERVSHGGAETPAVVMRDSVTTFGRPVTLQLETEQAPGYFLRGKRKGVTQFDVSSLDGSIRLPDGGSVELSARDADPATPTAAGVRLYAKVVGSKTALFARFANGTVVQLAIEP